MSHQPTLWDDQDQVETKPNDSDRADRERSRRKKFKELRAGGHWLLLLRVARTIRQPFTLNDISVAVWRTHPDAFGMKGYSYPDNHKVHYILYGRRGLVARGILQRVRQGLFRVAQDEATMASLFEGRADSADN